MFTMNRRILGLILIGIGASVWIPYFALKLMGQPADIAVYLPIHLLFVIPGSLLAPGENLYGKIIQRIRRDKSREESG